MTRDDKLKILMTHKKINYDIFYFMNKSKDKKPHIGIFGRCNNGKSSLINLLCEQNIAIVADTPGTTTDPVKKSIEIFGVGPSIVIDTAGIDDTTELGKKRTISTFEVIKHIDMAIILLADNVFGDKEEDLIRQFEEYEVPYMLVHNKSDESRLSDDTKARIKGFYKYNVVELSITEKTGENELIETIKKTMPETIYTKPSLFSDLVTKNDLILLVTPIDSEAPEGRMILPQVMAIRDVLNKNAICILVRETELEDFLNYQLPVKLVVTDSQAFAYVNATIPPETPLTSFSILFSRLKTDFNQLIHGTYQIDKLKNSDKVLILESCTHRVSCEDIGRFKLPAWLKEYTKKDLKFDVVAGLTRIDNPEQYSLVIQCGGCVATSKQITSRLRFFISNNIPVTNYGMAIAYVNGIFKRVTEPLMP